MHGIVDIQTVISLATAIVALVAAISSILNRNKIDAVHVQINSRMDELISLTRSSALAEGKLEGAKSEDAKT